MNPILIRYHDEKLKDYAQITSETAQHFATTYGLDFLDESGSYNEQPHMKKVELTLRELNAGRPFVVYADCDIVFHRNLPESFVSTFSEPSMSMTSVYGALQTSFFIAKNDKKVKQFFSDWLSKKAPLQTDEPAFVSTKFKYRGFKIVEIPLSFITNTSTKETGSVGKHFYSTSRNTQKSILEAYKQRVF